MNLRMYRPDDAEVLAGIYQDAVRTIGPQAYDEKQIEAWARSPEDLDRFRLVLSLGVTLIAEEDGDAIAFGQFCPPDHLSLLYCRGRAARRGVGSLIYDELERRAIAGGAGEIRLEASHISRPLFEKKGFKLVSVETSVFKGVEFKRFIMSKDLVQPWPPGDG